MILTYANGVRYFMLQKFLLISVIPFESNKWKLGWMQWLNLFPISVLICTSKTAAALATTEVHSGFGNRMQSVLLQIQATDCVHPNFVKYVNTTSVIWNASAYVDLLYDYGKDFVVRNYWKYWNYWKSDCNFLKNKKKITFNY